MSDMRFNPIGLVVDALELAGIDKPGTAAVLDKLAARHEKIAQGVARTALGGAVVAGQAYVDALGAEAKMMRQAGEGLRQTAKREADEAAADKPAPGSVLAETT